MDPMILRLRRKSATLRGTFTTETDWWAINEAFASKASRRLPRGTP
jgi:hypothetical protein